MLRQAISDRPGHTSDLTSRMQAVAQEFAGRGLQVDLLTAEVTAEPPGEVIDAMAGAVHESLANVLKHAGVSRVVVRVVSDESGPRVTVRDQGKGFDPSKVGGGFGMDNSIKGRLAEVAGEARITSSPGRGTRVDLVVER